MKESPVHVVVETFLLLLILFAFFGGRENRKVKFDSKLSEREKREWSVYTTGRPIVPAWSMQAWPSVEVAWWQCTMEMPSRRTIWRKSGK